MKFEDFIKKEMVRRASRDVALAKSLLQSTIRDLKYLNTLEIIDISSRSLMVNYYDVLRRVIEAISVIDGYKIYSHEAFTYFLKEKGEEIISIKFDRFRKIRNSLSYYGKPISVEEAKENIEEIKKIIKILTDRYLGDLE